MQLYEDIDDRRLTTIDDLIRILAILDSIMEDDEDHENIVKGILKSLHSEL